MNDQDKTPDVPEETRSEVGLPAGSSIGKYEITRLIGAGAHSVVYLGRDRLLDRPVAIKQISANLLADPRFLKRFRSEARILAQLGREGACIVSVFDLIENEKGMFIAMEYVDGRTLKDVLSYQKYALPVRIAGEIVRAVSAGLKAAHAAGIVHRDIKPGNIMVTRAHEARIMDFGVAARAGQDDSLSLGTTKYMAPEVFKGAAVDGRVDIYSLGIMLYEMLTGREYFDHVFAEIVAEPRTENLRWMKWHCDDKTVARRLDEINPRVNATLGEVVARMMVKDPDQRYASIDEFLAAFEPALAECLSADTTNAAAGPDQVRSAEMNSETMDLIAEASREFDDEAPTGRAPLASDQVRRRVVVAVVAAVALLLGAVAFAVHAGLEHRSRMNQAAAAWQAVGDSIKAADQAYAGGRSDEARDNYLAAEKALDAYLHDYADLPAGTARPQAWLQMTRANLAMLDNDMESVDAAMKAIEDSEVLPERALDDFWARYTVRRDALAYLLELEQALGHGNFDQAEQARANYSQIRQPPRDIDQRALELFARLDAERRRHEYNQALALADAALTAAVKIASGDDLRMFPQAEGALTEAEDHFRRAAQIETTPEILQRMERLARARSFTEARQAYLRADASGAALDERIRLAGAVSAARPDDPAARELVEALRAEQYVADAQALLDSADTNDLAEARRMLQAAADLHEMPETRQRIEQVNARLRRMELLEQAADLRRQANYVAELDLLRQASELESDDLLADLIEQAEVESRLQIAENLRRQKRWQEAMDAYEQARKFRVNDGALAVRIDGLVDLLRRQKAASDEIEQGGRLMKEGDYDGAVRRLLRGIEIGKEVGVTLDEARALLAECRYQSEMAKGQRLMEAREPRLALGHFQIALKNRDTPEIRELIVQARQLQAEMEAEQAADTP